MKQFVVEDIGADCSFQSNIVLVVVWGRAILILTIWKRMSNIVQIVLIFTFHTYRK